MVHQILQMMQSGWHKTPIARWSTDPMAGNHEVDVGPLPAGMCSYQLRWLLATMKPPVFLECSDDMFLPLPRQGEWNMQMYRVRVQTVPMLATMVLNLHGKQLCNLPGLKDPPLLQVIPAIVRKLAMLLGLPWPAFQADGQAMFDLLRVMGPLCCPQGGRSPWPEIPDRCQWNGHGGAFVQLRERDMNHWWAIWILGAPSQENNRVAERVWQHKFQKEAEKCSRSLAMASQEQSNAPEQQSMKGDGDGGERLQPVDHGPDAAAAERDPWSDGSDVVYHNGSPLASLASSPSMANGSRSRSNSGSSSSGSSLPGWGQESNGQQRNHDANTEWQPEGFDQ